MPNHMATIEYAESVGLVVANGEGLKLTETGSEFIELNPELYYELTLEQKTVLARNHYFGGAHQDICRKALSKFRTNSAGSRLLWSEVDDADLDCPPWLTTHLCQLGVLERVEYGYETTHNMSAAAAAFLDEPKGLTEEKLRAMLQDKLAVGDIGEKLVVKYERERLATAGAIVESHCVKRIGNVRVSAGYDVESFDGHSATKVFDRFIEVKASKGKDLRFFWTENEMRVAAQHGDRYWIYFLGGIDPASGTSKREPLMFQNPIVSILEDAAISKISQGLIVEAKMRGTVK